MYKVSIINKSHENIQLNVMSKHLNITGLVDTSDGLWFIVKKSKQESEIKKFKIRINESVGA